jgi:hypothetical protein
MPPPASTADSLTIVRRLLLAVLTIGLIGTGAELVAVEHFEDARQIIPLVLIGLALAVVFWNAALPGRASVRAMQAVMAGFIAAGLIGIYLHYMGNLEFQLEIDPSQSRWALFKKVIQAKAPPALAPGSMAQLAFIGLIWAFRHPALDRSGAPSSTVVTPGA